MPHEEARAYFYERQNSLHDLDTAAEELTTGMRINRGDLVSDLAAIPPKAAKDMMGCVRDGARAGNEIAAAAQGLVGVDRDPLGADRSQASGASAQRGADLVGVRRTDLRGAERVGLFYVVEFVVATHQEQRGLAAHHLHQCLDLAIGGGEVEGGP